MDLSIACLYLIIIGTVIYLFFKYRFSYWERRGVPQLPPSIPYGSLKNVGKTKHFVEMNDETYSAFKNSAPFSGLYISIKPVAIVTDLDLIRDILIKDFNYFHDRPFYFNERDDPISAHMASIEGTKWRRLRNILSNTFTPRKMKFMFPTLMEVAAKFAEKLHDEAKTGEVIHISELVACYTTDVIGTCIFGIECDSLNNSKEKFRSEGRKVFEDFRHSRTVLEILSQFPKFFAALGVKFFNDDVSSFFMGVIRETVAYREKYKIRRNDCMDLLIELKNNEIIDGEKLSIEEIAAQAFLFYLGGFETSSTAMSYTLYELALNPDLQVKARCEIEEVLAKHDGQLTYEALMDMKYIGQIFNESLRKYTPLPWLIRKATKNYPVPNTDKIIEKGTTVFVPNYSIHNDPDLYPNPEVFDPDRFLPEEQKIRHPMSFLGFGDGPRNCIGLRFAQMQSHIGLITIIRNFHLKTCKETIIPWKFCLDSPVVLTAKGGLYLHLEKV